MKVVIDDCRLERMEAYTEPLNDKIKRQAAEITRLLMENDQLKQNNFALSVDVRECNSMVESARATGQEEAWKLMRKIGDMYCSDLDNIFDSSEHWEIVEKYTYSEAAAKVEDWERQKEEICVGDVVHVENIHGTDGIVTCIDGCNITLMLKNGMAVHRNKNTCHKTGRHIDVSSMLAQIGGGTNETEN